MNLDKKLTQWQQAQLLTAAQVQKIRAYEQQHHKPWVLLGFGLLGVFTVVLGIIALIAANWNMIGPETKLVANFIGYGVLGAAFYYTERYRPWVKELVIMGWFGYVLGTIALVGQIFHLEGELYQTGIFWSVLTAPLLMFSQGKVAPLVWFGVMLGSVLLWLFESRLPESAGLNLAFSLPFLILIAGLVLRMCEPFEALAKVCLGYSWAALAVLWMILSFSAGDTHSYGDEIALFTGPFLVLPLTMLALVVAVIHTSTHITQQGKVALYAAAALLALSLATWQMLPEALHHLLALISGLLAACYAALEQRRKLFNALILLVIIKVFGIYIELFTSLLTTGLGLVITGLLILATIWLWHRYSGNIQRSIAAWNQQ